MLCKGLNGTFKLASNFPFKKLCVKNDTNAFDENSNER